MLKSYEVMNTVSGHSFGFYAATSEEDAINTCCHEAGYTDVRDFIESTGAENCNLVAVEVNSADGA